MGKPAYLWRKLTSQQREHLLRRRKRQGLPWHRPPHRASARTRYHVTAACYEHQPHTGCRAGRLQSFCAILLEVLARQGTQVHAWCVLPNHYQGLIETPDIFAVLADLGRMHGRLPFEWNSEERT